MWAALVRSGLNWECCILTMSVGGRGVGARGRGRGRDKERDQKPLTKEALDADLDEVNAVLFLFSSFPCMPLGSQDESPSWGIFVNSAWLLEVSQDQTSWFGSQLEVLMWQLRCSEGLFLYFAWTTFSEATFVSSEVGAGNSPHCNTHCVIWGELAIEVDCTVRIVYMTSHVLRDIRETQAVESDQLSEAHWEAQ